MLCSLGFILAIPLFLPLIVFGVFYSIYCDGYDRGDYCVADISYPRYMHICKHANEQKT